MFDEHLERWHLEPDGDPIITNSSRLLPVRRGDTPAMLKIAKIAEESRGGLLMVWWCGDGAARVLAHEGEALLLERSDDRGQLVELAKGGHDDEASRIICRVAARLHAPRRDPPPERVSLPRWFRALEGATEGILKRAAETAQELLAAPRELTTLHGDIHHGNILHFGSHGWLAIDPKGLVGERGFDFANTFLNPDQATATAPGRLVRQSQVVAEAAGLERPRLLKWILAYAGLSAVWALEAGDEPALALAVARLAAAELSRL